MKKKDPFIQRETEKYENPVPSREFIIEFLSTSNRPLTYRQLLSGLTLTLPHEKEAFSRRLKAMLRDGQLIQNRRGAFGLPDKMDLVAGHVIGHRDGFGFIAPDDGSDDLFINARHMRRVFHEDHVLARVIGIDQRGRREGAIVEVTKHNTNELAGRLIIESGVAFLQPSNTRITQDILIPPEAMHGAKNGQMVVIRITTQPSATARPVGEVIEVIGDHMAPGMEIDLAIRNHDLPHEWPDEVLSEASHFAEHVPEDAFQGRVDLLDLPFVTIDGEDAKDFDDAVYCEKTSRGWTLFVAIADVSHYVRPDTALDREALNRGNSVYFPGRVIPMLPEKLSNGLCSLNPDVNRLAIACEMHLDQAGKITHYEFHEAVFKSRARLTYNEVYASIVKGDPVLRKKHGDLVPHLFELFAVYRVLARARKKRGSIDFDLPETKIIFGADRKIDRIIQSERNDAHRVIEECMLSANICAAKFLLKKEYPGLYRVHRGPTPEKLEDVRKFLNELALTLPGGEKPQPLDYAVLLNSIGERPDANMIQTVLLRSLSQAVYSPHNEGHFGLAFDAYAHFTSPIRRYPDLLVHRSIRAILRNKKLKNESETVFEKYGEHCSMTERRADDATREAIDWLKCEYMLDKVGQTFPGVISSVTSFGIFVQLNDIFVEGLVHISQLPNDYYHFDPLRHEIYAERSGVRYRLGQPITILVARVDLDQRQMDFVLAEEENNSEAKQPGKQNQSKRKSKSRSKSKEKSKKKSKKS
ncbi:MAG: ribonuclease R [Gammaproteobacteria bacterium]|nr:ribonuclease R [Gammaproteobacteria bacterium]